MDIPHSRNYRYTMNFNERKQSEKGGLAQFFVHKLDYTSTPPLSFSWPKTNFGRLKVAQPNVTDLTRSSCEQLVDHSRYVDINFMALEQYAKSLNKEDIVHSSRFSAFQLGIMDTQLSEREIINMSCFYVILQYGAGFRSILHKFCAGHGINTIQNGVRNMQKRYPSLDFKSLSGLTIDDVSEFFEIDFVQSRPLKLLCESIRKCIMETVHILYLKQLDDFADYVYHYIDIAWIKSQTKDLSAIETIEWELNEQHRLGLTLAPTKSQTVKRCVLISFIPTLNPQRDGLCQQLVRGGAFLYAVNDLIIYNRPFIEIITIIKDLLAATEANDWNPFEYKQDDKRIIALQFGLHLRREPETMQTLLYNFVNDFSALNDQYLYQSFFAPRKHLKVYLFQSVQSLVSELYYNVYVKATRKQRNNIFNFKGITTLTAVVDNVIPFVLLHDGIINLKREYQEDWNRYIEGEYMLQTSELEIELISCALCAVELLMSKLPPDINIVKFSYYLRNQGRDPQFAKYINIT